MHLKKVIGAVALSLLVSTSAFARGGPPGGSGGGGMGGGMGGGGGMEPYSASSFVTVEAVVQKAYIFDNPQMGEKGLHLKVSTAGKSYTIHAGPGWYNDKMQFNYQKGEKITVSGSEFHKSMGPYTGNNIYAATIVRNSASIPKGDLNRITKESVASIAASLTAAAKKSSGSARLNEKIARVLKEIEQSLQNNLGPEIVKLRNPDSGFPLWSGRHGGGQAGGKNGPSADEVNSRRQKMMDRMRGGRGR